MTKQATPELDPGLIQAARDSDQRIRKLHASAIERIFESGTLLKGVHDRQEYLALGHETFEEYLGALQAEKVVARSTAYGNIRIAEKFDTEKHGHLGVSRLRVLSELPDAALIAEHGFEEAEVDRAGKPVRTPVVGMKVRHLKERVRLLKAGRAAGHPPASGPDHEELDQVVSALLANPTTASEERNESRPMDLAEVPVTVNQPLKPAEHPPVERPAMWTPGQESPKRRSRDAAARPAS